MRIDKSFLLRLMMIVIPLFIQSACSSAPAAKSNQVVTNDQRHVIQIDLQPNPAKILKENMLHISLPASLQQELKEKTVKIQLSMPGMDHGILEVQAKPNEQGEYIAPVTPTMIGDWKAELSMEGKTQTITATFDFDAVR
ncbi:hypothetical protein [Brevibacillus sp. SYSU BS000544]|uniref:hypothetical protein n=1 Tax=Brevibacillus sp. SYSU BS000544 TaxID=3416443 RepID=UPI003CE4A6E5